MLCCDASVRHTHQTATPYDILYTMCYIIVPAKCHYDTVQTLFQHSINDVCAVLWAWQRAARHVC